MKRAARIATLALSAVLAVGLPAARAHFHVLMPQNVNVPPRGTAEITYWVGHPFEHMLTNASRPAQFFAVSPDGERQDLMPAAKESGIKGQEGKSFAAWRTSLKAAQRGDYVLAVVSQPVVEGGTAHQAFIKTVLHAKAQKGWDRVLNLPAEMVPLTRPYGLSPGTLFQVQVLKDGKPVAGAMVEIERCNEQPLPESQVPADEFVTRVVKTDPNGIATLNLPEVGWWGISAEIDGGSTESDGKQIPSVRHATYWVFVSGSSHSDPGLLNK